MSPVRRKTRPPRGVGALKHAAAVALALLIAASSKGSMTYYVIELRDGSRIFSLDRPVRKGLVALFHRYPDGVYLSLAAAEVRAVVTSEEPPKPEKLAPGQTVFLGPAVEGPNREAPQAPAAPPPPADMYMDSGYGYYGWWWGGGYVAPPRPPRPLPPVPPSRIGPNGFPILAPPGFSGSTPPAIGPNGFPILAPPPPVAAPRQR